MVKCPYDKLPCDPECAAFIQEIDLTAECYVPGRCGLFGRYVEKEVIK